MQVAVVVVADLQQAVEQADQVAVETAEQVEQTAQLEPRIQVAVAAAVDKIRQQVVQADQESSSFDIQERKEQLVEM